MKNRFQLILFLIFWFCSSTFAQNTFVYGDALPDAPELADRGPYVVGVRTLEFTHKDQLDILHSNKEKEAFYDRKLTVEVWYPAGNKSDEHKIIDYQDVMGVFGDSLRPIIPFTFAGRAVRNADAVPSGEKHPLIIVSHGYVGSRYLMTYLTENLASKGYVVVAIDHLESTFTDRGGFQSTLLNRAKDITFVMNSMVSFAGDNTFLKDRIDADNIGLIGYSMGGYGVLNVAGAAYSPVVEQFFGGMTGRSEAIASLVHHENQEYRLADPRIKAVVAFAPWGMERGVWNGEGLKGLKIPTFFVAGDQDDVSGYERGIKAIFDGAVNADRYLLTYKNARHNVAPNPAPMESLQPGLHFDEYYRYAEPSWDSRKINNVNQHFITAFLGIHLKGESHQKYLQLSEQSNDNSWIGFPKRGSTGMEFRFLPALKE